MVRLTPEQLAVVTHDAGHARVAAVAGSGKTTTMAARVLHLLEQQVPPQRMLVLMFNRSARDDFQRRLVEQAPPGQRLPDVRTFHSLGHRLTQSLCRWQALDPRQLLAADWQLERVLRQATLNVLQEAGERRDAALEGDRLEALAHFCGLVKAEVADPTRLHQAYAYDRDTDYFPAAFQEAERLLEHQGVMTYSDLLYRPLLALESDDQLRARVEGFLDHVIVDEYQDINAVQQRLLAILAGSQAQVMAVGDANQCIYEWRGARPDSMLENFTGTFGQATDYPLSVTFRHGHALALSANHAIAQNQRRPDQICLALDANPATTIGVAQGSRQFLNALADWQQAGRALNECCLMVRSWALSVPYQLALLSAGIPFRLVQENRFVFRLPLVQALAGYLKLARHPSLLSDAEHISLLMAQPTPFVSKEQLRRLAAWLAAEQAWPDPQHPVLQGLKSHQKRTLKKRWTLLCELPSLDAWSPARLLRHVVDTIDAEKTLKRAASRRDKGEEDVRLIDVLIEQAASVENPDAFIELLERPVENQADGVLISTVHAAKGLEWPMVVIGGVNEEDFPHYSRDNPLEGERLEEERRLFYVAVTRACEQLLILHDAGQHQPSRFIGESAWLDCLRVTAFLSDAETPEPPLVVAAPALVERYLKRCGRDDIVMALVKAADQVKESSNAYSADAQTRKAGTQAARYFPGQRLTHAVFGEGEVAAVEGSPDNPVIEVRFDQAGRRRLVASQAPIKACQAQA